MEANQIVDSLLRVNPGVVWVAAAVVLALATGSVVRCWSVRGDPTTAASRLGSLVSWWVVAVAILVAAFLDRLGIAVLMVTVSWLAFREFVQLVGRFDVSWYITLLNVVWIPLHYLLAAFGGNPMFAMLLPMTLLVVGGILLVLFRPTSGFIQTAATLFWGAILTVTTLVHVVLLLADGTLAEPAIGRVGFVLYLIFLTEGNDIAQALVGRSLGRHRIAPIVSPHKTWEGLCGGAAATTLGSAVLGFALLPEGTSLGTLLVLGLALSLSGFLGDLHMSALKRDLGVKDSGRLFPGQGGMLDRIDSLTFNAPLFYYLAVWLFSQ